MTQALGNRPPSAFPALRQRHDRHDVEQVGVASPQSVYPHGLRNVPNAVAVDDLDCGRDALVEKSGDPSHRWRRSFATPDSLDVPAQPFCFEHPRLADVANRHPGRLSQHVDQTALFGPHLSPQSTMSFQGLLPAGLASLHQGLLSGGGLSEGIGRHPATSVDGVPCLQRASRSRAVASGPMRRMMAHIVGSRLRGPIRPRPWGLYLPDCPCGITTSPSSTVLPAALALTARYRSAPLAVARPGAHRFLAHRAAKVNALIAILCH